MQQYNFVVHDRNGKIIKEDTYLAKSPHLAEKHIKMDTLRQYGKGAKATLIKASK